MDLRWCRCCRAFAADAGTGRQRLCLLCVMHCCDGRTACEVPGATLQLVLDWESEILPPAPPAAPRPGPPPRPFPDGTDDYILLHYSTAPYQAMADALGVRYAYLQWRVKRLIAAGLLDPATRYYQAPWSPADEEYLRARWGMVAERTIARRLGRTVLACWLKAKRLGLAKTATLCTARTVARIFAIDDHAVVRWITLGWLKAKRSAVRLGKNRLWSVDETDLIQFIARHPTAYDRTRIDPEAHRYWRNLADRVAAAHQLPDRPARAARHWTPTEDRYLEQHWGQDPDVAVATQLGRTIEACYHRAYNLAFNRQDALTGWLTASGAARTLGVPVQWVQRWLTLGLLPATRSPIGKTHHAFWRVSPQKLRVFAEANPALVHPERYLTAKAAAAQLGVAVPEVIGWITSGRLPATKRRTVRGDGKQAPWVIDPAALAALPAPAPVIPLSLDPPPTEVAA